MWASRASDVTEDGHKVLEYLRTTRGRIGSALLASLVLVALAVVMKFPLAIVPALLVPVWVSAFAGREADSHVAERWLLVLTGGLALLAGLGVLVFVLVER
jgi:ABC-type phosphate transport system permease subunit